MAIKLEVKNLYKVFGEHPQRAFKYIEKGLSKEQILEKTGLSLGVKDASLAIEEGEIFVIMGLSGSGKSTMVRLLNRLIEPTRGQVLIDGVDIAKISDAELREVRRKKIAMVFQSFALMPHMTVLDNTAFGMELAGVPAQERHEKALDALRQVGLENYAHGYPDELSGGMRQRVGLARALAINPDILLMDEAFSALDPLIRTEMQDELVKLQAQHQRTIVFISHDLSVVEHIADEVMVMYLGRCVEKGTKDQIFNNPRHPYTQALLSATPRLNPDDRRERIKLTGELPSPLNPPPGCAFNARCRRRFGPCTQLQPQLKDYGGQLVACFAVDQDENGEKPQV